MDSKWYWQPTPNKLEIVKEKNKRTGLIVSVLVHAALLVLFAFFGLTYLEPPPAEEGISINFGNVDMGKMTNNDAPPTEETDVEQPTEPEFVEPVPTESAEEDIVTQNTVEAPSIDKKKEEEKKVEDAKPKEEEKKPDPRLLDALDKLKNNKATSSGGDGTTEQSGDQGDVDGDNSSTNYNGGGAGNGLSFSLTGRSMINRPRIDDQSQEQGKVVVDIIVDQKGNVVRAVPGARGSNTASAILYEKAKKAALETKFSANPDAAIEQKGQMTFIFILN